MLCCFHLFLSFAGKFLYINSAQMRSGDTARIASPVFPASRGVCYVRFWYNMYGSPTMGPINVSYLLFLKKKKSYVCFNT